MNPYLQSVFLVPLISLIGYLLGQLRLGSFRLGVSATLFVGMAAGWYLNTHVTGAEVLLVEKAWFDFPLMLFMVSTGLLAAGDVVKVFRGAGRRLLALTVVTVGVGALSVLALFSLFPPLGAEHMPGVFTGAITSSPGLAIALEAAGQSGKADAASAVGLGYALSYPFSVVVVVLAMGLLPRLFPSLVKGSTFAAVASGEEGEVRQQHSAPLNMAAFAFTAVFGYLLGQVTLPLGGLGRLSLQTSGGMLVAGLLLGNVGRIGPLDFRMNKIGLTAVQQVPVVFIFSYVGLTYGYGAVGALSGPAALLVLVGLVCTTVTVLCGFLFGSIVLKLEWIILSGAICGSMTSTPGLGAALENTGDNRTAGAYGSTYPVGLLAKVIVVLLMYAI